jgi:hypothetical protein
MKGKAMNHPVSKYVDSAIMRCVDLIHVDGVEGILFDLAAARKVLAQQPTLTLDEASTKPATKPKPKRKPQSNRAKPGEGRYSRERALTVACPVCKAPQGRLCFRFDRVGPGGKVVPGSSTPSPHKARYRVTNGGEA